MRILALDIETRPAVAYVWRPYDENVGVEQIIDPGGVICFAAKWVGEPGMEFRSDFHDGHATMVKEAWRLLDEADVVLHFNGTRFDVPHLQREFMEARLGPPAPFREIDLYTTVKRRARFFSNRLAHVAPQLGLKGKLQHEGFPLWKKCLDGDPKAWVRMRAYNKRDVTELEELYELLRPWVPNHPSHAAHAGEDVCPRCGSSELKPQGYAVLTTGKYQRYRCVCGAWSRSTKRVDKTNVAAI